jgi:hypothetical protein
VWSDWFGELRLVTIFILNLSGLKIVAVEDQILLTVAAKYLNAFLPLQSVGADYRAAIGVVLAIIHAWNLDPDCVLPNGQLKHRFVWLVVSNEATINVDAGILVAALHANQGGEPNRHRPRRSSFRYIAICCCASGEQGETQENWKDVMVLHGSLGIAAERQR